MSIFSLRIAEVLCERKTVIINIIIKFLFYLNYSTARNIVLITVLSVHSIAFLNINNSAVAFC